jgi:polysaccharide pyruvyl transferase WcaK-like protein
MDINTIEAYYHHTIRKLMATVKGLKYLHSEGEISDKDCVNKLFEAYEQFEQRTEEFIDTYSKKKQPKVRQEIKEFAESMDFKLAV